MIDKNRHATTIAYFKPGTRILDSSQNMIYAQRYRLRCEAFDVVVCREGAIFLIISKIF